MVKPADQKFSQHDQNMEDGHINKIQVRFPLSIYSDLSYKITLNQLMLFILLIFFCYFQDLFS